MNAFRRLMVFSPRGHLVAFGILLLFGVWATANSFAVGTTTDVGCNGAFTVLCGYIFAVTLRGKWRHRKVLKLRNQVRRRLKQLMVHRELTLVADGQRQLDCAVYGRLVRGFVVVVSEPMADEAGLYQEQTFDLLPVMQYVTVEAALARDEPNDEPEEDEDEGTKPERALSFRGTVVRQNWQRLRGLSAAFANKQELAELLNLLNTATPCPEYPDPGATI